ncbi:RanBP1 domain protein, partial [Cooperia oncophora]
EKKKEHEKPSTSIVTVTTGEENDVNIFQTACKLHSFDKEKKAWVERGLAHIRINQRNEDGEIHHRIGKSGFGFGITPSTHVHLEKKSLDDVLGKMAAEKKLRQEQEDKGQPMFVFGSKISDRVVKEEKQAASSNGTANAEKNGDDAKPKTAEELFKCAAQQDKPKHEQHDFIAEAKEAAEKKKEHEKPKHEHSYRKRGPKNSRVLEFRFRKLKFHVARTTGNHRVVINSRVHADMFFERVDQKRLKISATTPDSNAMQIFLVTIGFSKTALNIDEFCAILDGILKKEKACESLKRKRKAEEEPGAEKVAKMNIRDEEVSNKEPTSPGQEVAETKGEEGNSPKEQKSSEE